MKQLKMRTLLVFSAFFLAVFANPTTTLKDEESPVIHQLVIETAPGVYGIEDLTGPIPHYEDGEDDVKFYFASRENKDRVQVDPRDPNAISKTAFSSKRDTWFIVHGWKNDFKSDVEESVGNALLEKADVNIFCVDWNYMAKKSYLEAFGAVAEVGRITGELVKALVTNHGLQLDRSFFVGHSLGAHVAGRVGAAHGGNITLIVGLDPAGPMFTYDVTDNRLDHTDAQYVHVIHTCTGILGFRKPLGHADYYANGGDFQPACPFDVTGSCSHSLAYIYFAESIISGNFKARSCTSKENFDYGNCNDNVASEMGGYSPDRGASGTYYLNTHNKPPYAMG